MTSIIKLRRRALDKPPAADEVIFIGSLLLCERCELQWLVSPDEYGDIGADQAKCPSCATEPPRAA